MVIFHGLPGSRLQKNPDTAIAADLGLRVITVDRPGFGRSDPAPNRSITDWPADVAEMLDRLGVSDRPAALGGWSGGGPYVAACAALLPTRFSHAVFVSSLAPMHERRFDDEMDGFFRLIFGMARRTPWLLDRSIPVWRGVLIHRPEQFVAVVQKGLGPQERALFRDERLRSLFVETLLDGSCQGPRGPGVELRLAVRDWGVDLAGIRIPTHVWHGDRDSTVPVSMGRALAAAIPGATLRIFPREGHFLAFTRWRELLTLLAADPAAGAHSPSPAPEPPGTTIVPRPSV